LKDLWQRHQALRWLKQTINEAKESQAKEGHSVSDYFLSYLKIAHKIGPYEMWPLISDHLKLLCHLDILFLRNENPGVSS
jgi:hypothetical protein